MSGLVDEPVKVKSNTCLWMVPDYIIRDTSISKYKLIIYCLNSILRHDMPRRIDYKLAHRVYLLLSFLTFRFID